MTDERTREIQATEVKELRLAKEAYQRTVEGIDRIFEQHRSKKNERIAAAKGIHQAAVAQIEHDYRAALVVHNVENEGS